MPEALPLLTNSRLRTHRECARKEKIMYQDGYRPVREGEALRFGTLVHHGLEAYWLAIQAWQQDSTLTDAAPEAAAFAAIARRAFDGFEQAKAEEMIRLYAAKWRVTDELEYEVLAVEPQFRAPLLNPETMHPSKTWQLAGKIDVIVRRRRDGRVLVVDHKTSSDDVESDDSVLWSKLAMDSQPSQYVLGAEALGFAVDELLWDVLKKPAQRPKLATPVEKRKYTKTDGKLHADQREFDETPDEYRARIREAMEAAPDRFMQRRSFPRSNSQIQDFMYDSWQQAATMRESARLGRAPRNPDSCFAYGRCPLWTLCSTGGDPVDYPGEFQRVENVHPELEESK